MKIRKDGTNMEENRFMRTINDLPYTYMEKPEILKTDVRSALEKRKRSKAAGL